MPISLPYPVMYTLSQTNMQHIGDTKSLISVVEGTDRSVALFYGNWHGPSVQMKEVLAVLSADSKNILNIAVDVETLGQGVDTFGVLKLPVVVFYKNGIEVARVTGADPPQVSSKYSALERDEIPTPPTAARVGATPPPPLTGDDRLRQLTTLAPVMVFMKGSKAAPFCKFSRAFVEMFSTLDVEYSTFNILMDDDVREGLKKFSNWPTYPQLYINGEFVGGLDVTRAMYEDGSLQQMLKTAKV
eukprot:GHVO01067463.1.p1 GENE.GHVO01067463.1~~GHVO01067463.1.p1  ORF type:complete len:244 (+),score=52.11 GHVO01067463.1:100-831(+)